ncbi:MAG: UxaA family hydrolase, partial [Planctomycetota bacterium]
EIVNRPWQPPDVSRWAGKTFMGYPRADGRAGTANHWIVVPMVFCQNRNLDIMRHAMLEELGYKSERRHRWQTNKLVEAYRSGHGADQLLEVSITPEELDPRQRVFPNVDGVKFLNHIQGCGGTFEDAHDLCALLAGYIAHPNVAGATVMSLGCQKSEVRRLMDDIERLHPGIDKPVYVFEQQAIGSEERTIEKALKQTFVGLTEANDHQRRPVPINKLTIGMECGGSDGFSGISANPAIGRCSDLLVALGGSVILSEFPELAGTEQDIVERCKTEELAQRFLRIMDDYALLADKLGTGFDRNPSPGNIADGLVTDAIKSAGAVLKGGSSPITDVLDYTEPVRHGGLNLLCTPGGDIESTTAMVGSGANLIVFSTGLGTPTGNPIAPTLKVSTNSTTAQRMPDIIDVDAGSIIREEATIEQVGDQLLNLAIATAEGAYTPKAVALGQDDFIPWKRGISL